MLGKFALACLAACIALQAQAKEKIIILAESDAAALRGKTLALTVHERPGFAAMTAGKASFALFGVAAMIAAGNKLVDENHIADPAILIRAQLADLLRDVDGMQVLAIDTTPTTAKKAGEIAKTHPDSDYVLDVRSTGWGYVYFPTDWSHYWIGYGVQVQLIDAKSGRQLAQADCGANTQRNKVHPTKTQMEGDDARLLKDVTTAFGWDCVRLLAEQELRIPAGQTPSTPTEYLDPLAKLAASTDAGTSASAAMPAKAAAAPPSPAASQPPQTGVPTSPVVSSPATASTAPAAAQGVVPSVAGGANGTNASSAPAQIPSPAIKPADSTATGGEGKPVTGASGNAAAASGASDRAAPPVPAPSTPSAGPGTGR